jgi:hypothetical protein
MMKKCEVWRWNISPVVGVVGSLIHRGVVAV